METRRGAWVGAFVVGGVLLFAVGLFLIGDRRLLFTRHIEIASTFGKVTGVQVGTRVRLAGLDVGEVLEIGVPPRPSERFLVRFRIREDMRNLVRHDSVAAIQTDGLVGNAFLQLGLGSDASPIAETGTVLTGADPIEFGDLIQEGRDTFRRANREILDLTGDVSNALVSLTRIVDTTDAVVAKVGNEVERVGGIGVRVAGDVESTIADVQGVVENVRSGKGTIGRLFNDTAFYDRLTAIGRDSAESARVVRETAQTTHTAVQRFIAPDGVGPQMTRTIRTTLDGIEEVTADLAEATEALKRNILFRGFFRERGFFDLDAISREAYRGGLLERDGRTAVRIWLDADVLFSRDADGVESLTAEGRRRLDSAMAQLVQYPRESPLVVEGYARDSDEAEAYLASVERSATVRDYVLSRFRRAATLTDAMPLSARADGSPSGDGRWAGVALTMYVRNDALGGGGRR